MHQSLGVLVLVSSKLLQIILVVCRQAVVDTMQKFGLKTTKSKRARREAEAEEEAEATLQFKVSVYHRWSSSFLEGKAGLPVWMSPCNLITPKRKCTHCEAGTELHTV